MPPESVLIADQQSELNLRKHRRMIRRDRKRRGTANFTKKDHGIEVELNGELPNNPLINQTYDSCELRIDYEQPPQITIKIEN
jgi:hypothetical protein